jgi:hypothetical protein
MVSSEVKGIPLSQRLLDHRCCMDPSRMDRSMRRRCGVANALSSNFYSRGRPIHEKEDRPRPDRKGFSPEPEHPVSRLGLAGNHGRGVLQAAQVLVYDPWRSIGHGCDRLALG